MSTATDDDRGNNQSNDGEKSESLRGWIAILVSALLVCMTAALFVAGQSYRSAYMYELGFDLAQLPGDFHETLFWGFSGGTPLAVAWMIGGLIATAISAALFWLSDAAWWYATTRWGAFRRMSSFAGTPKRPVGTHVKLVAFAFLLLPLTYGVAMAYIGAAEFQKLGAKRGKEIVVALQTNPAAAVAKYGTQRIEIRLGAPADTIIRGYRLLCTESLCSIYDPDPKVRNIRVISLEGLREIRLITRFDVDR